MNLASTDGNAETCSNRCLNNLCVRDSITAPPKISPFSSSASMEDSPDMKDPRKLAVQDMNHISLSERDQAYEDLHGVRQVVNEDDELVAYSLNQMEEEIFKIKAKPAYLIAEEMSKEFVQGRKLRLTFLRSARFNTVLAAGKFVKYFENKLELFGEEKLTKTITIDDLGEDGLFCLMSGRYQLLPYRDRSGRAVAFIFSQKPFPTNDINAMLRSFWYFGMSVLDDEETQRKGVVFVFYMILPDGVEKHKDSLEYTRRATRLGGGIPINVGSAHFCFNKSKLLTFVSAVMKNLTGTLRARTRFHEGSDAESQFALMTYGIPVHALPITNKGRMKVDNHLTWIQKRRGIESAIANGTVFNGIYLPAKYDILLGRGKPIQNYTGNERLRQIVKEYSEQFYRSAKGEKAAIVATIVKEIKESSCRFLKEDKDGGWVEVPEAVAKTKVATAFRTLKKNNCSSPASGGTDDNRKRVKY